jgi:hypothetical protein
MSARILQAARPLARPYYVFSLTRPQQQRVLGGCIGLSLGAGVALRSSPRVRLDSPSPSSFSTSSSHAFSNAPREKGEDKLNPELMKQLSGGSVTGFLSGLLVSVFSKTLVLLLGVSVVIVQVRGVLLIFYDA